MATGNITHALAGQIHPIMGALKSVPVPIREGEAPAPVAPPALPFVTISREAGAGGRTLAGKLLDRLRAREEGDPPWAVWDSELVDKVAQDFQISHQLIDALERSGRTWLERLLGGLMSHDVDDMAVYRRVAATIRAIAQAGHAIVIGRGGVFVTQHMPQGVHVRLIAPHEARVHRIMKQDGMTRDEAHRWVIDTEAKRDAFYQRFYPRHKLAPEVFTVMFNTAQMDDDRLADAVAALVPRVAGGGR